MSLKETRRLKWFLSDKDIDTCIADGLKAYSDEILLKEKLKNKHEKPERLEEKPMIVFEIIFAIFCISVFFHFLDGL